MIEFELAVLTVIGLAVVLSVNAALYVLLPQSVLESWALHGRFGGLGTHGRLSSMPRGHARARILASPLAHEA